MRGAATDNHGGDERAARAEAARGVLIGRPLKRRGYGVAPRERARSRTRAADGDREVLAKS